MITNFGTDNGGLTSLRREIEQLEATRKELLALGCGQAPSIKPHPHAPRLDPWSFTPCLVQRLMGFTADERVFNVSTEVVFIDEVIGWALTRSGWVQLGQHAEHRDNHE